MYPIEEFTEYDGQELDDNDDVLTWCKKNGYQFIQVTALQNCHQVVGYRKS